MLPDSQSDGSLSMEIGDHTVEKYSGGSGVHMKEHVPLSYFAKTVNMLDDDEEVNDYNEEMEMNEEDPALS